MPEEFDLPSIKSVKLFCEYCDLQFDRTAPCKEKATLKDKRKADVPDDIELTRQQLAVIRYTCMQRMFGGARSPYC